MPARLDLDQAAAIGLRERRSSSPLSLTDERESRDHYRSTAPRNECVVSGIQSELGNWLVGDWAKTSHARYGLALMPEEYGGQGADWAGRVRDRLIHLSVEGAEALANLPQPGRCARRRFHQINLYLDHINRL